MSFLRQLCFVSAMTIIALVMACGSETASPSGTATGIPDDASTTTKDGASASDSAKDAISDAPSADGPFACGTVTCGASQWCVNPCCGGPAPLCEPNDSGACPAGFHAAVCNSGLQGCEMDQCTPPPAYCVDAESAAPVGCIKEGATRSFACQCA